MRIQQVRKVRRQRRPGYPTRPEVARYPELLRRHVPLAWKKSAQVTAALSIMMATAYAQDAPTKAKTKHVAPIFEHGGGFYAYGGPPTSPPTYLSEEEACKVISEELQKAGISGVARNVEFKDIPIKYDEKAIKKQKPFECDTADDDNMPGMVRKRPERFALKGNAPLKMDLVDEKKGIAVEFISFDDAQAMGGRMRVQEGFGITNDLFGTAEALREKMVSTDKAPVMYYGIFYDPSEWINPASGTFDLLRAQVRDFIEWLKGQGAI